MANNPLETKAGQFSLMDGLGITASKIVSEELLAQFQFVGNGTYRSGIIKAVGALSTSMISKNKGVQLVATGMMLDAAEDIVTAAKSQFGLGVPVITQGTSQNSDIVL